MSFRQKLLLLFAATVFLCVAVISVSVYSTMRQSFEQANQERANAVAAQFRSEFQRRGQDVVRKVESIASSETVQRMALEVNRGASDSGGYLTEAKALAGQQQLDFLEARRPSGNDPLVRAVASEVWISRGGDPIGGWFGRRISEARRIARRLEPRLVCGPCYACWRTAALRHRW